MATPAPVLRPIRSVGGGYAGHSAAANRGRLAGAATSPQILVLRALTRIHRPWKKRGLRVDVRLSVESAALLISRALVSHGFEVTLVEREIEGNSAQPGV